MDQLSAVIKSNWQVLAGWLLLVLAIWPVAALAHGGGIPQLVREPAGPFLISVWTLPDPLEVGEVNFVILVTDNQEEGIDNYILDADVELMLTHRRTGEVMTTAASHEDATNNLFYESYLDMDTAGNWQVDLTVDDGQAAGEVTFQMDIGGEATDVNWPLYGGLATAFVAVGWIVLQIRRR